VVGIPSREWGETPAAFIVLRAGETVTADVLKAWFNGRVGKTQRLTYAIVVETLPRSSIGKVLKRQLRDEFKPPA
jgi:acyl-CoA synthetase (AMP-forming)/AMP-acid ligase II